MDLIKKLTGKNPDEYEGVAKSLVDNSDVNLFAKLVKQDTEPINLLKTPALCVQAGQTSR